MRLAEAAAATGGELRGADVAFEAVCSDSRSARRGDLFVALRGERFDGHHFLDQAARGGAVAALVERAAAAAPAGLPLVAVDDTAAALGRLAAHWRRKFSVPLIAVAGSNGKTTVKEMIAACARAHWGAAQVHATPGNLNNHIGLPLSVLMLRAQHRCAVIEIGMNHPGETRELARIAQPTVGIVNNAQREHQEFMRSVGEVAREHGALFDSLPPDGVAVINADDAHAGYWRGVAGRRRVRDFGLERPAAVSATCRLAQFHSEIHVRTPEGSGVFTLPAAGRHNAANALGAIAAATAAGVALGACLEGLSGFVPVTGRMQVKRGAAGAWLIDDTYNANPDSVRAAIDVLARAPGRRLLVLGDMGEVGAQGPAFHEEIGRCAREAGVERLYAIGEQCAHAVRAFGAGARHFARIDDLLAEVEGALAPEVTVLVKGSRFMRMERVVQALDAEREGSGRSTQEANP
jgi:UDP-N-acetylmuramoyl-tripeptide--D-alanyl-D-alanine ligase